MNIKNITKLVIAGIAVCGGVLSLSASEEFTVYVNPGERIENARDQIRNARKTGTLAPEQRATVILRPGIHTISTRFELGPNDGGMTVEGDVTYKAEKPDTVFIRGGKSIPWNQFKPAEGMDGVFVANVASYLITQPKVWPSIINNIPSGPWLYLGGEPQTLARWPNDKWATFTNAVDKGEKGPGAFVFEGDRIKRWDVKKGLWLTGYWTHDWADCYLKVQSFDPVSNVVRFAAKSSFGIGRGTWGAKERRFYAVNLLEELDAPGEWYLDRNKKLLYFMPVPGMENKDIVLASFDQSLFCFLRGVKNVKIENLNFEYSHSEVSAFEIVDGDNIKIKNCSFSCLAGLAIKARGTEIAVSDCKFRNIGGTVVRIEGGDRKLLIPARNVVERCDIGFYGRFKQTFQPAMGVYGCGSVVRDCKFHDGPYISLWYFGNEHLIANNEFTRVVLEAGDSSAVYSGRDASSWGNVFFGNNIHDLGMDSHLSEFRMGIYLDDCDCGDRIIGNTFRSCGHAVFIGGGNGNIVANNLMEDTPEAVHLDSRGMTWKLYANLPDGRSWWHNCNKDFDYRMPPWSIAYPELPGLVDDNPNLPWMNTFKGNQIVRCKSGLGFKHKAKDVIDRMVIENNTIITNETKGVLPQKVNFSHAEKTVLRSPNGKIEVDIKLDVTGRLSWKMKVDSKEVVSLSPLGITVDKRDYGRLVVPCKAKINQDEKALFATIPLKCLIAQDIVMYLDLRLTDKLLKWRWRAPEDGVYKVHGEFTRWNMIENAPLQLLHSDVPQGLSEGKYFVYEKNLWGVGNPFDLLPKEVKGNILSPWRITMIK